MRDNAEALRLTTINRKARGTLALKLKILTAFSSSDVGKL